MPEEVDRRGRRGAAPAVVGARPEGGRDLPRQLQGRPAAVDGEEGRRRDAVGRRSTQIVERIVEKVVHRPVRQKLPRSRRGRTFEFRVADCKGFATIGEYDDGRPGEIFLTVSKQGSTLSGIMDAFAKSISYGLQYGVPLRAFVEAFTNMRFEPAGMTDDPDIRFATLDHGLPVPPPGARVPDRTTSGPSWASSRSTSGCSRRCPASRRRSSRPRPAPRSSPTRSRSRRPASSPTRWSSARSPPTPGRQHAGARHRPRRPTPRCACSAA